MNQQLMSEGKSAGLARPLQRVASLLLAFCRSIRVGKTERAMRLCESLPLGEKRYLAIVQCQQQRFLIGVTNQSISLLREMDREGKASWDERPSPRAAEAKCA